MRNIEFIRLQNFIAQYAPTKKKKNYMLNKLNELEQRFKEQENEITELRK